MPNPSDKYYWDRFDWSVFGHEIGHDLIGFDDNMGYDKDTVMSRRSGPAPSFIVSETDIEFLLDSARVIHSYKLKECGCK